MMTNYIISFSRDYVKSKNTYPHLLENDIDDNQYRNLS